jgi:transposase
MEYYMNPNRRMEAFKVTRQGNLRKQNYHMNGGLSMFYGIDLHSDSFNVTALGETNDEFKVFRMSLSKTDLQKFRENLTTNDYVAVESSTNTFWFAEQIEERVKKCYIIDPYKFSIIANSNKKTDRIDSLKLARKLKYYVLFDQSSDEFPTVYMPVKEVREIRGLFTSYELIKQESNTIKNRIRSLLSQNGILEFRKKNLSAMYVQKSLLELNTSVNLKVQIGVFIDMLRYLLDKKDEIKKQILIQGQIFNKEIGILTSIRGISPFLAIAIMSDIADINRFPNAKHLCSYLRTAPVIDSSGEKNHIGKVNKHSRTLTISLMTESVKHFIDSSDKMHSFYFAKRKGKTAGKVRVAVMRKMLVIIYKMLTRNELYYYRDKKNHDKKLRDYAAFIKNAA